jgi:hypothetical protein
MRIHPVLIRFLTIVRLRWNVDYVSFLFTNTFPAMEYAGRDDYETGPVFPGIELIQEAASRRTFAVVVQDRFYHASDACEAIFLNLMVVPCLDDTGIHCAEVHLAETAEKRIIAPHDLHQAPALIGNYLERLHDNTMYQLGIWLFVFLLLHNPSQSLLAPPCATKFDAFSRESKVPASVHQPSNRDQVMVPCLMYILFTSVISSSPRWDGDRVRIKSKT